VLGCGGLKPTDNYTMPQLNNANTLDSNMSCETAPL